MDEPATPFEYVGNELELFAGAVNWKNYFRAHLVPFIGRQVLEVGAGVGGTTRVLCSGNHDRWVCLEPDASLLTSIEADIETGALPACCQIAQGILPTPLISQESFDTILYIDVLEHIEDDLGELQQALTYLKPGGHVIVLSPAHNWLFSPFDTALGHFRRYSKTMLRRLTPPTADLVHMIYLDSVGLFASLANRLLLKQRHPTQAQIEFWDRRMVPVSQVLDPLLGRSLGKSVVAVWRKKVGGRP